MNLLDIKQYMMRVKLASLSSLSLYFNVDPDTLRPMLSHWVRKGCLRSGLKTPNCGSQCGKCSPLVTELYEWVAV